jgi:DNA modification methylase
MGVNILVGDCRDRLKELPDASVHCCVTSPPYFGLRDYGVAGQIGLEPTPDQFVSEMVDVFREVRRVLRDDGVLWLNMGDSYAASGRGGNPVHSEHQKQATNRGSRSFFHKEAIESGAIDRKWVKPPEGYKQKDLIGIPWQVAFALRADGWYLSQWLPWLKRNPMPESANDRPTVAIEIVFLLSKSRHYEYNYEAVKQVRASDEDANGFRGGAYVGGKIDNATLGKRTAVGNKRIDKRRGHSRRHAGFNDRWDAMERSEQSATRAFRNTDLFFASLDAPHGAIGSCDELLALDVATHSFKEAHFATFPPPLIEPMVKAGCPAGGTVLDPFGGAGTTGLVAQNLQRNAILIELNPDYAEMAKRRIANAGGMFADVTLAIPRILESANDRNGEAGFPSSPQQNP